MPPEKTPSNMENLSKGEELLREARFIMREKGFPVDQTGLNLGEDGAFTIGGQFSIDEDTEQKLKDKGISVVRSGGRTSFAFDPQNLDQEEISKVMLEIAQSLPESKDKAE